MKHQSILQMQLNRITGMYSNLVSYTDNPISSSIVNFSFNSSLRASYTDIFGTNKWKWGGTIPSEKLTTTSYVDFETTILTLTYTVNFGNNMLREKRLRKTGSKEEQERFK